MLGPGDAGMSRKWSLLSGAYSLQAGESDGPYSRGRPQEAVPCTVVLGSLRAMVSRGVTSGTLRFRKVTLEAGLGVRLWRTPEVSLGNACNSLAEK